MPKGVLVDSPPQTNAGLALGPWQSEPRVRVNMTAPCLTFAGATECGIEWAEWVLVDALIAPSDTILELGARFGTTSCALARATNNSGRVVSVEPDTSVYEDLLANRKSHNCNFHAVLGVVSSVPMSMMHNGPKSYATMTVEAAKHSRRGHTHLLPSISASQLQERLALRFSVVLVDCEGCIDTLFKHNKALLDQVRLVLLEEDGALQRREYDTWYGRFRDAGFRCVWRLRETYPMWWSRRIMHSAWSRDHLRSRSDCNTYAFKHGYTRRELACVTHVKTAPVPPPASVMQTSPARF